MLCLFTAVLSRRHVRGHMPNPLPPKLFPYGPFPYESVQTWSQGTTPPSSAPWTAVNKQVANLRLKDLPVLFCCVYTLLQANIVFVLKHIFHIKHKGVKDTLVGLQCLARFKAMLCLLTVVLSRRTKSRRTQHEVRGKLPCSNQK